VRRATSCRYSVDGTLVARRVIIGYCGGNRKKEQVILFLCKISIFLKDEIFFDRVVVDY
jgi:hypothetical protein